MTAVPKAVPSAVAPSTGADTVTILTKPQLGPHQPMTGKSINPVVPRTETEGEYAPQPHWISPPESGSSPDALNHGAPSVPRDGFMWQPGPIDAHYTGMDQAKDPYGKVNNPPTRGMFTWIKTFVNGIAKSVQEVDPNGFRTRSPQQRTSVMRITPPAHGMGYAPETFQPRQLPQRPNTYKYPPVTGTQPYGSGVLNSDTFGAGQTAGGQGGAQYTPPPGPPPTVSTSGASPVNSGMPVWG